MDIAHALVGELVALVAYALILVAVYKIFQVHKDLGEIKALLKTGRNPANVTSNTVGDSAEDYAQSLLRSVQTESRRSE